MTISRPVDYDRLIDDAAADPEQNLPYWAELWPSGVALAGKITCDPRIVRGRRVLELGCGLGVTAVAALKAGADLLVTDYSPEALTLCALNALDQAGVVPRSLRVNWRDLSSPLHAGEAFPIVLAADVLYERRDVEPLLALVDRVVATGGKLWLAEPGRPAAAQFLESILAGGWTQESEQCAGRGSWSQSTGCGGTWFEARRLFSSLIVGLVVADDDGLALFAHELLHVVRSQPALAGAAGGFPTGK